MPQPHTKDQPSLWPAPVAHALAPLTVSAQTIVAEWIDRCRKRPPGRVIGQVAKHIAEMLAEGVDPDDIRRGVAAWMTKGLHPAALAAVVNEVMNRPRDSRTRPSTTDDRVRQALAIGAELQAEADATDRKAIGA